MTARPLQAAGTSAGTFAVGAALPLLVVILAPLSGLAFTVSAASLVCLAGLFLLGAWQVTPLPRVALADIRNAHAMTLATVDPDGRPSARMVICRGFDASAGSVVFYTDRESAKGQALDLNPRAALVFNWDAHERQVRIDGPVTLVSDAEADAYWQSRPRDAPAVPASASSTAWEFSDSSRIVLLWRSMSRRSASGTPRAASMAR